jgi:hypothetical protein
MGTGNGHQCWPQAVWKGQGRVGVGGIYFPSAGKVQNFLSEAGHWWLMPVILATWEAEIGRIKVQGQPGQIVTQIPSPK